MQSWPRAQGNCNCAAQLHKLYANCLTCGKVLCILDKAIECPFCGHDPATVQKSLGSIQDSYDTAKIKSEVLVNADMTSRFTTQEIEDDDCFITDYELAGKSSIFVSPGSSSGNPKTYQTAKVAEPPKDHSKTLSEMLGFRARH